MQSGLRRSIVLAIPSLAALALAPIAEAAGPSLLNVSYDVAREFYKDYNAVFIKHWKAATNEDITINQSHGGSSKQARAVIDGLEADVVTMNQANDIDAIAERGKLLPLDWARRLPNNSAPTTSTTVILVRRGNPKGIKDWADLARPGVSVQAGGLILRVVDFRRPLVRLDVPPAVLRSDPELRQVDLYTQAVVRPVKVVLAGVAGVVAGFFPARRTYVAAWGAAIKSGKTPAQARELVQKIFANVPVFDGGGCAATTTFAQRGIGDALATFESEVNLIKGEFGGDFDVVYPQYSILAENPVALIDKVVDKKGTRKQAEAYLKHLWSDEAQEIAAKHQLRPRSPALLQKYAKDFPKVNLFTIEEVFGGWGRAQKDHFDDGAIYDQILAAKK